MEKRDNDFKTEAIEIARSFDDMGDHELADYILSMISERNVFSPQAVEFESDYLKEVKIENTPLPLPKEIANDISGVINAINHNVGINKFLFYGAPGTGKTESVKHLARIINKHLYIVDFNSLIDSKLGETSKNISNVFNEINTISSIGDIIILFDEIDAIAMDRVNSNDLREMGRVTSTLLKELDYLSDKAILIATTNLYDKFDKALLRRFDSTINFNRYNREDLIEVAKIILESQLKIFKNAGRNVRLFTKVLNGMDKIPYPGDLKNMIKTSLAFSDPNKEYDYLVRLFKTVYPNYQEMSLSDLYDKEFTLLEMEILTNKSKSSISRELRGE